MAHQFCDSVREGVAQIEELLAGQQLGPGNMTDGWPLSAAGLQDIVNIIISVQEEINGYQKTLPIETTN